MSIITRSKSKQLKSTHLYINSLCDNIEQLLACQICLKLLNEPITLLCGHTICSSCIPIDANSITCKAKECFIVTSTMSLSIDVILSKVIDLFIKWKQEVVTFTSNVNSTHLQELMLPEIECQLCYNMLLEPITSSCGHTLCKQCFIRSLDYNDKCPLCRRKLPSYNNFLKHALNYKLNDLIQNLYPGILAQRKLSLKEELINQVEETPLFVCSLVFPKMPCYLHIFEPRYRLMIKRCIESPRQRFGIILHVNKTVGFHEYGTMLEARNIEVLSDGRYLLDAIGSYRFKVIERGERDGYNVGKIERIDDDEDEEGQQIISTQDPIQYLEEELVVDFNKLSILELQKECVRFVDALKGGSAPWLFQRLNATVGPMPTEPSDFTFWIASIIPIDEQEKYKILPITSVKKRFLIILKWINCLSEQWWFERMCTIM